MSKKGGLGFRQLCLAGLLSLRPFYTSASSKPSGLLRVNHALLSLAVRAGDTAIDATCGNGWDSLYLGRLVGLGGQAAAGRLVCIDLQQEALAATRGRLEAEFGQGVVSSRIELVLGSHAELPHAAEKESVAALCYNLGYLPGGGDKTVTTQAESTLQSLRLATSSGMIRRDGLITVMAYRHAPAEEEQVRAFLHQLSFREWDVSYHRGLHGGGETQGPVLYSVRRRS